MNLIGQVSTSSNTWGAATDYIGWDITVGSPPLFIKTELAQPINFYTDAGAGGFANLRMLIDGTSGFVGIGNNLTPIGTYSPLTFLDVFNSINVNNDGNALTTMGVGYFIGNNMVFQIPGTNNSFIGNNTGAAWTTGQDNTFVGKNAGRSNTSGSFNTFIGSNAGAANDIERFNTYVGNLSGTNNNGTSNSFFGHHSGSNTVGGNNNTFIGEHAGFGSYTTDPTGSNNTFVGERAGQGYATAHGNAIVGYLAGEIIFSGAENAFFGNLAGRFNTLGSANTFVGFRAGQNNIDGRGITLIGHMTFAQASPSISNATALGASAAVITSNSLILGDNNINVGIGLSGVAGGPTNKLEINDNINGGSGLNFRQLTAADPATFIPNGRVLTVDGFGEVVLTSDIGGTGSVSACVTAVPADENFITKWEIINTSGVREICRTRGIYESPSGPNNTIGIGVGSSPDPSFRLHMKGDFLIERNGGIIDGNIYMANGSGKQRVFVQYGNFGYRSLAIGADAGPAVLSTSPADKCVYIGRLSGRNTVGNVMNTFLGDASGYNLGGTGNGNTFVGAESAFHISAGDYNTMLGYHTGRLFQSGNQNIFVGTDAGTAGMTNGNDNILIGSWASITDLSGNQNIIIGTNAYGKNAIIPGILTNAGTIGHWGIVECSNCFTIAAQHPFAVVPQQQVGIGFRNPSTVVVPPPTPPLLPASPAKLYVSNYNGGTTSAYFAGSVYAPAFVVASDSNLKENIQPLTDVSNFMSQLEAKTYNFKLQNFPTLNLPQGNQVGFIAQDLETVAPNLVTLISHPAEYDTSGNIVNPQVNFKSVNYSGLIPILFTAIKQQQSQIDSLIQVVAICCNNQPIAPESGNKASIDLSNHASIILNQNAPNPFHDKTEISYTIPEEVKSAAIVFYDQNGKILNRFEISHSGAGSLTVYGDDLSNGIYTYTLLIGNNPVKTKRMVKE